jgi:hypothetical protein
VWSNSCTVHWCNLPYVSYKCSYISMTSWYKRAYAESTCPRFDFENKGICNFYCVWKQNNNSINTGHRTSGWGMSVTRHQDVSKRTQRKTVCEMPVHFKSKNAIGTEYDVFYKRELWRNVICKSGVCEMIMTYLPRTGLSKRTSTSSLKVYMFPK